jgi:hypothetical protein
LWSLVKKERTRDRRAPFELAISRRQVLTSMSLFVSATRRSLFATSFSGIHSAVGLKNASATNLGIRSFTQTCILRATHYETLGVPHNATKGQIKSSFYSVSFAYDDCCVYLTYMLKPAQQETPSGYQSCYEGQIYRCK